MNNKALSPLMATIILVLFALVIGTITMNLGKDYVDTIGEEETSQSAIVINMQDVDTPLKQLQIKYITDQISKEEYLTQEKTLI
jgi:flagellin-like protein